VHTFRLAILVLLLAALPAAAGGAPPSAYQVIVNPRNPTGVVERKFLADVFLKKITRWSHEEIVRPVDLRPDSPVRQTFCDDVLKRSVAAVKSYWQQLVFSGRDVPPPELGSDDEVVAYVLKHAGAVGYVSGGASLQGAKILIVR
jgi:ABC-type phosphate transport system substrate-binding protein